jgi:hypothetical protein
MAKHVWLRAACLLACLCCADFSQAQYGGVQVRVGGYGTGVRVGGYGYGNALYGGYGNGFGYGNGYGHSRYQNGYGYGRPSAVYLDSGNNIGLRYNSYPTVGYRVATPRYYAAPMRRFGWRRFR